MKARAEQQRADALQKIEEQNADLRTRTTQLVQALDEAQRATDQAKAATAAAKKANAELAAENARKQAEIDKLKKEALTRTLK